MPLHSFMTRPRRGWIPLAMLWATLASPGIQAQAPAIDLGQLERQGKLEAAYEQAVAESAGLGGLLGGGERHQQIEAMRERLAQIEWQRLEAELKRHRQVFGAAALSSTAALRTQGDRLRRYDEARHAQWLARLDSETERTRKVMETVRAKFDETPESDVPARLDLLKSLALLGGAGSDEEKIFLQAQAFARDSAYRQGSQAHAEGRHAEAGAALEFVVRLDPGYKDAGKLLLLSRIGAIEDLWAQAPDDAARGRALQLLRQVRTSPDFAKYAAEAAPAAARLQARNVEQVRRSLDQAQLIEAIGGVLRGRQLASALGSTGRLAEESALLERLREAATAAGRTGMPSLAYAYQRVADELLPGEPETRRQLDAARRAALAASAPVVRVEIATAGTGTPGVAEALRARLAAAWPAEVVRAADGAPWAEWTLNLVVTGAGVEADERKGRKLVRMPGGAEDVAIELRVLRKQAHLDLAISLLEADAAPVAPTPERFRRQAEDEAHDGLQVGGIDIPVRLANLPTDAQMLEALATEAVAAVAGRFPSMQAERPRRLAERAARLVRAGDGAAAANALALAAVLREQEGQPSKAEFDRAQREALLAARQLLVK